MKSIAACLVGAVVLCVGLALATSMAQEAGNGSHGGQIEGTWRVTVTLRNCQTEAEIRHFPAMLSFAQGGTLTGTSTVFPPSARGGDFGIWQFNGHGSYSAVSEAFIFNGGTWFQPQRITQAITLSQDANTHSGVTLIRNSSTLRETWRPVDVQLLSRRECLFDPGGFASKISRRTWTVSVPPRGSGWVDGEHVICPLILTFFKVKPTRYREVVLTWSNRDSDL